MVTGISVSYPTYFIIKFSEGEQTTFYRVFGPTLQEAINKVITANPASMSFSISAIEAKEIG